MLPPTPIRRRLDELLHRAHCPYSHFPVAVIIEDSSGTLFHGVNVESAAFPSGICAEKAALAAAVGALGSRDLEITTVWIATRTVVATPPCGSCRQILSELAPAATVQAWATKGDAERSWTVPELLPDAFDLDVGRTP
ncbi:MAG: cytidine deaminase [Longimicrobiales bacterium]|nr:cytidine deaminase [Longimicrobiales bacterium]